MNFHTFTVNISVAENWINDGYDLTQPRQQEALKDAILEKCLGYAQEDEIKIECNLNPKLRRQEYDAEF